MVEEVCQMVWGLRAVERESGSVSPAVRQCKSREDYRTGNCGNVYQCFGGDGVL